MLSLSTAYRSFDGEVEASSTPTICRLPDSRRHQIWAIARRTLLYAAHNGLKSDIARHVRVVPILLKKSFWGDGRNF
jgi:hypothetical protein